MTLEDPEQPKASAKDPRLVINLLLNAPSKTNRAHIYLLKYRCDRCRQTLLQVLKTPPYRSVVTWEHPLTLRKMGVKAPRMDGWKFYQIPDDAELRNSEYRTHRTLPHLRPSSETRLITSTCRCAGWQFPEVSVLNDLADKVDKRDFTPPAREPEFE